MEREEMFDEKAYNAWLNECQEMWDPIYLKWAGTLKPSTVSPALNDFMLAVFSKAGRHYHYFLESWKENKMLEESGRAGDKHGGTGVESGVAPVGGPSQRGIEGTKPQTVLDRGTHPKATEGESGSSPEPAQTAAQAVLVRVEGKTYESRYDLRVKFGLVFENEGKFYVGKIPPEKFNSLVEYCVGKPLILSRSDGKTWVKV